MPDHQVKEQPAASTFVPKKGVLLVTVIVEHPVGTSEVWLIYSMAPPSLSEANTTTCFISTARPYAAKITLSIPR